MAAGLLIPIEGAVVRGFLKVGGRTIAGPLRAAGPEGVDLETKDLPPMEVGTLRCMGRPGQPMPTWAGIVTRIDGGARVSWPANTTEIWPALRTLFGLGDDVSIPPPPLPTPAAPPPPMPTPAAPPPPTATSAPPPMPTPAAAPPPTATPVPPPISPPPLPLGPIDSDVGLLRPELSPVPSDEALAVTAPLPPLGTVNSGPLAGFKAGTRSKVSGSMSAVPSSRVAASRPPPVAVRATSEALQTAQGEGLNEPARAMTPILHLVSKGLGAALARAPGELSPLIDLDGMEALRARDVLAARVVVGETAIYLEATVITVRQGRARVRLAIPSLAVRALLESAG